jgi:hypothetical protein
MLVLQQRDQTYDQKYILDNFAVKISAVSLTFNDIKYTIV